MKITLPAFPYRHRPHNGRTQRNRLSPNVWDAPDVASGTEAIIAAINTSRKPRTSPIRPPDSSSVSTRLSFNAGPQVSYRSASDQPAGPSEPDAATPSSSSSTQRSLVSLDTDARTLREFLLCGRFKGILVRVSASWLHPSQFPVSTFGSSNRRHLLALPR